jgi:hypothetical protein
VISTVTEQGSPSQRTRPPQEPSLPPPGEPLSRQPPPEPSAPALTEEKEPNDDIATATVITEGTTVHGLLGTDQDRDFFRFNPSSDKTRVIVRTHAGAGFVPMISIFDHVEKLMAMDAASFVRPASLSFESIPGSMYYIMVQSMAGGERGKYELVVRKE